MITITLNGQELEVREKRMVLEVAREQGIDIPSLCYHEALGPYGACRLCLVEAEGPTLRKGLIRLLHPTGLPGIDRGNEFPSGRPGPESDLGAAVGPGLGIRPFKETGGKVRGDRQPV